MVEKAPTKNIFFFSPGPLDSISGGYIFNLSLIKQLKLNYLIDAKTIVAENKHDIESAIANINNKFQLENCIIIFDGLSLFDFQSTLEDYGNNVAFVCINHLPNSFWIKDFSLKAQEFQLLKKCRSVIVTSEYVAKKLIAEGLDQSAVDIIYPTIDIEPIPISAPTLPSNLLTVANFEEKKRQHLTISALNELKHYPWSLKLVGSESVIEDDYFHYLKELINNLNLTDRIEIIQTKERAEIIKYYEWAHLFILTTTFETYGMAIAEARACKIPVIVTDVGGIRESSFAPASIYVDSTPINIKEAVESCLSNSNVYQTMINAYMNDTLDIQYRVTQLSGFAERIKHMILIN